MKLLFCTHQIADHTGYHFQQCRRKAKYIMIMLELPHKPTCGLHKKSKYLGTIKVITIEDFEKEFLNISEL